MKKYKPKKTKQNNFRMNHSNDFTTAQQKYNKLSQTCRNGRLNKQTVELYDYINLSSPVFVTANVDFGVRFVFGVVHFVSNG